MVYPKEEFTGRSGRIYTIRSPEKDESEKMLAYLLTTAEETEYGLSYPEELTLTVADEEAFITRCAEGCGAHGLVIPKRHAAGLSPVVSKASAGAIGHLAVAKVPNIAATIETLKKEGVWIYAAEAGAADFRETDMNRAVAIVLGSEGAGVSEIVRKKCDYTVSIPMYGRVNSFNVSTAAAVLLCEAARQQRQGN